MNDIGTIASIVAAITGIVAMITGIIAIRNSKGTVIKRIERKEEKISEIRNQFLRTYGLNANVGMHYPTSSKIDKLQKEIENLDTIMTDLNIVLTNHGKHIYDHFEEKKNRYLKEGEDAENA